MYSVITYSNNIYNKVKHIKAYFSKHLPHAHQLQSTMVETPKLTYVAKEPKAVLT